MSDYHKEIDLLSRKIVKKFVKYDREGLKIDDLNGKFSFFDVSVLNCIAEHEGIVVQDLIRELDMDRGVIATCIGNLVSKGYIDKRKSEEDKRKFILTLTDKGRRAQSQIIDKEEALLNFVLNDMSINEKKAVLKFLSKVNQTTVPRYENY